ncbi:MAG: hypothetical protein AABX85_03980 [Nanoarchaeota archaeon]
MSSIIKNKRGNEFLPEQIIFIVLNIAFFVILMIFIFKSSNGAIIYEQTYAKQIALLIDRAKPGTTLLLDIRDGMQVKDESKPAEQVIKIDNEKREVIVSLGSSSGYRFKYFSDYDIEYSIKKNYIVISINDKKEAGNVKQ